MQTKTIPDDLSNRKLTIQLSLKRSTLKEFESTYEKLVESQGEYHYIIR